MPNTRNSRRWVASVVVALALSSLGYAMISPGEADARVTPGATSTRTRARPHVPVEEPREVALRRDEPVEVLPGTPAVAPPDAERFRDPVSEQGQRARGLYFTGPYIQIYGAAGIIRTLRRANLDTAVIDLKDGQGRITYNTNIPTLSGSKRGFIDDGAALIRELKAAGIYTAARVVCFSDPILARAHPELAVMDTRPSRAGQPWVSWGNGSTWLDPYNPAVKELVKQIAIETAAMGFDEIQFDYVRFPVDEGTRFARFPHEDPNTLRRFVILDMLRQVDEAVNMPIGVDVFGLTTLREGDPAGLGQSLEDWVAHVEVYTPMLYINNYKSWTRRLNGSRAASFIYAGTSSLRERIGDVPVIRPFMQAFRTGADHFDAAFIADQVRAARGAGADGFLFWNPGAMYTVLVQGMTGPARALHPFPMDHRIAARQRTP